MKVTGKVKVQSCTDWPDVNERNWEAVFKGPSASRPSPIAPVPRGREADACVAATDMIAQPRRHGRRVTEVSTCPLRGRRHPEQTTLYEVVRQHLETHVALVGEDGWDRHGVPITANLQILRYVGWGILDYGSACSQWLDSVHSSDVGSRPGPAVTGPAAEVSENFTVRRKGRRSPRPVLADERPSEDQQAQTN